MKSGKAWAGLLMAVASSAAAQTPGVIWESMFDQLLTSSPQRFYPTQAGVQAPYSIQLTPAPNGDYYLHVPDWTGKATVSRLLAHDDSVLWRRIVSGSWTYMTGSQLGGRSMENGDALVIAGGLARFSADGDFLWSRAADAATVDTTASVHPLSNGDLLLSSANPSGTARTRLSRIDSSNGALVDGFALPAPEAGCHAGLLGVDPVDALYVVTICLVSGQQVTSLSRLASDQSVLWTHTLPAGTTIYSEEGRRLIDAAALYVNVRGSGEPALMRLSASDGTQSWVRPGVWTDLRFDAGGRVLASIWSGASHRVDLLNPLDGQLLWSHEMVARGVHLDVAADGIYLAGTDNDQTYGLVERLDPDSGSVVWQRTLTGPVVGGSFRPGAVLASTPAIRVAGADCLPETDCRVGVVRIDRADGSASPITYPAVPQDARGNVVADGYGHVLAYRLEPVQVDVLTPIPLGQQVRVRRIDTTGVVEWERVLPVGTLQRLDEAHVRRTGDGDLLLWVNTPRVSAPEAGYPYLAKYSGTDGQLRWEKRLLTGFYPGGVDFVVDSDSAGNIFVGESSSTYQGSVVGYVRSRSLSRLDAASGEAHWTQPVASGDSPTLLGSAPRFSMIGDDVLLFENPSPVPASAFARLSGATGAVVWVSTELATPGADLIAIEANEGFMRDTGNGLKAFSTATGEVRWTYRYVDPVATGGTLLMGEIGDDGDLYFGGMRASGAGWVARVARSDGAQLWVNHLDDPIGAVRARAIVRDAVQGHVHVTQRRVSELFLTRLDQETGAFVDSSLLSRSPLEDEAVADDGAAYLRRMPDGQILAPGTTYRPGEARRPWVGRLAAPSAGTRGNLALSLDVSPAVASSDVVRTLTLPISYEGENAVSGVLAFVALGTAVSGRNDTFVVDAFDCTTTGSGSCSAVPTPTGVRLRLDMAPGSTATLTAQLRLTGQIGTVAAKVHAPYGLFESDMRDNETSVGISADRLFVDDFE